MDYTIISTWQGKPVTKNVTHKQLREVWDMFLYQHGLDCVEAKSAIKTLTEGPNGWSVNINRIPKCCCDSVKRAYFSCTGKIPHYVKEFVS